MIVQMGKWSVFLVLTMFWRGCPTVNTPVLELYSFTQQILYYVNYLPTK